MDLYGDLGIDKKATTQDIKKAYYKKAQEHHPDKGGDSEKFNQVSLAYSILSDDEKRSRYDNGEDFSNNPNSEETRIMVLLAEIFSKYIQDQRVDLKTINIFKAMEGYLDGTITKMGQLISAKEKALEKYNDAKERLVSNDENKSILFERILLDEIDAATKTITKIERDKELRVKALAYLEGLDWKTGPQVIMTTNYYTSF